MSGGRPPPDLAPSRIAERLRTARYGRSLDVLLETGSTMDVARAAAESGAPDGHVVLADHQSAGRGSHGRPWLSPAGVDLYLSVVARPELPSAALASVTLAVGIGVAEAAESLTGARAEVKWPNDVWLGGEKCAGVLVESRALGGEIDALIVGIGLNVNRSQLPAGLAWPATSLRLVKGSELDRADVLAALLDRIESWVKRLELEGPAPVVEALGRRLALRGERVRVDATEGELIGVDERGALVLQTPKGPRTIIAGSLERVS